MKNMNISRAAAKAVRNYGRSVCEYAYRMHAKEGFGASGILHEGGPFVGGFQFKTVNQVDAAINAGRELESLGGAA